MKDLTHEFKDTFWDRMEKVTAGMLHTDHDRVVPMSHYVDRDRNCLWFITADGTDAYEAAQAGKSVHHVVAEQAAHLYAKIDGKLSVSNDKEKLDELWSPVAAMWFEDGREDEHVRLVQFVPSTAEIWATEGNAGFLYEVVKANVSKQTAEGGDHGTIRF